MSGFGRCGYFRFNFRAVPPFGSTSPAVLPVPIDTMGVVFGPHVYMIAEGNGLAVLHVPGHSRWSDRITGSVYEPANYLVVRVTERVFTPPDVIPSWADATIRYADLLANISPGWAWRACRDILLRLCAVDGKSNARSEAVLSTRSRRGQQGVL